MIPPFLRTPDPDHSGATHADYLRRARYAYPFIVQGKEDRRHIFNEGTIYAAVLDVDTALVWAERLASEALR